MTTTYLKMSELSKEVGVQYAEDGTAVLDQARPATKRSFGTKAKHHCSRFWWLHLIILIVVVLVITLPVVFVGYPHIAQRDVNRSLINVTSMSILSPTPDSIELELSSVLTTHSSFHPQLDAFNASLYLEDSDQPFAQIEVPAVHADNGAVSHLKQKVQISNVDQFSDYAKTVISKDEYIMILKGRGGLKQSGLPKIHVNYNKIITMKGFNGLIGFQVTNFSILTTTLPDGTNMNGTVLIPNPTVMTIAMGNVTMALSVAGTPIGVSTLPDLTLTPGNSTYPMRSITNQSAVVGLLLQSKYKSGILPVDTVGNTSTYNGQDLTYYDQALQGNKLSLDLDVGKALEASGLGALLGLGNSTSS